MHKMAAALFAHLAVQAVLASEMKRADDFSQRAHLARRLEKATERVRIDLEAAKKLTELLASTFDLVESFMSSFDATLKSEIKVLEERKSTKPPPEDSLQSVFLFSRLDQEPPSISSSVSEHGQVLQGKDAGALSNAEKRQETLLSNGVPPLSLSVSEPVLKPTSNEAKHVTPIATRKKQGNVESDSVSKRVKQEETWETAFKWKNITFIVVDSLATAVGMHLYGKDLKKQNISPPGVAVVNGAKVVYKSAAGNRFFVFVKDQLPEAQKDLLRKSGFENWVFNLSTNSALEAFIKEHEEEIRQEVERCRQESG